MRWFKFYIESLVDETSKIKDFSDEELGVFVRLLSLAAQLESGGEFRTNKHSHGIDEIVSMAGCTSHSAKATIEKLGRVGTLVKTGGCYSFKNWVKYQDEWERKKALLLKTKHKKTE